MAFYWDIKYFSTVERFDQYLNAIGRNAFLWVRKFVIHHTYIPTIQQWRGYSSMVGLGTYYRGLGWDSGPQLFIGPDGIYQGTPVYRRGIHAGICNPYSIGIEVVGNYDVGTWPESVKGFVYGALNALTTLTHLPINQETLIGHRNCASPKTCPGKMIDLGGVIQELQKPQPIPYRVLGDGLRLRQAATTKSLPILDVSFDRTDIFYGIKEVSGEYIEGVNKTSVWVQHESKLGFASKAYLEKAG